MAWGRGFMCVLMTVQNPSQIEKYTQGTASYQFSRNTKNKIQSQLIEKLIEADQNQKDYFSTTDTSKIDPDDYCYHVTVYDKSARQDNKFVILFTDDELCTEVIAHEFAFDPSSGKITVKHGNKIDGSVLPGSPAYTQWSQSIDSINQTLKDDIAFKELCALALHGPQETQKAARSLIKQQLDYYQKKTIEDPKTKVDYDKQLNAYKDEGVIIPQHPSSNPFEGVVTNQRITEFVVAAIKADLCSVDRFIKALRGLDKNIDTNKIKSFLEKKIQKDTNTYSSTQVQEKAQEIIKALSVKLSSRDYHTVLANLLLVCGASPAGGDFCKNNNGTHDHTKETVQNINTDRDSNKSALLKAFNQAIIKKPASTTKSTTTTSPVSPQSKSSISSAIQTLVEDQNANNIVTNMNRALQAIYEGGTEQEKAQLKKLAEELAFNSLDPYERIELTGILSKYTKDKAPQLIARYLDALDSSDRPEVLSTNYCMGGLQLQLANTNVTFAGVEDTVKKFNSLLKNTSLHPHSLESWDPKLFTLSDSEKSELSKSSGDQPISKQLNDHLKQIKDETGIDIKAAFDKNNISLSKPEGKYLLEKLFEAYRKANPEVKRAEVSSVEVMPEFEATRETIKNVLDMTKYADPWKKSENQWKFLAYFKNGQAEFSDSEDAQRQKYLAQALILGKIEGALIEEASFDEAAEKIYNMIPDDTFSPSGAPEFFMRGRDGKAFTTTVQSLKSSTPSILMTDFKITDISIQDDGKAISGESLELRDLIEKLGIKPNAVEGYIKQFKVSSKDKDGDINHEFNDESKSKLAKDLAERIKPFIDDYAKFTANPPSNPEDTKKLKEAEAVFKLVQENAPSALESKEGYIKISYGDFLKSFAGFTKNLTKYADANKQDLSRPIARSPFGRRGAGYVNQFGKWFGNAGRYAAWSDEEQEEIKKEKEARKAKTEALLYNLVGPGREAYRSYMSNSIRPYLNPKVQTHIFRDTTTINQAA